MIENLTYPQSQKSCGVFIAKFYPSYIKVEKAIADMPLPKPAILA
jgi:hypothetical protein